MSEVANWSIVKGDSDVITSTFVDSVGDPITVTGYDFFFTAKKRWGDTDANAVITKDPTAFTKSVNIATLTLTTTDTAITSMDYVYDFQYKDGNTVKTYARGILTIKDEATIRIA